jgi:DNA primase
MSDTRIPQADIEAACARVPVSEIARRHVALKRSGRELAGLCPFHQERSASFFVNDDKGFYHCFGCGAHGDQITLLMRLSFMSFNDAVTSLLGREPTHQTSAAQFMDNARKAAATMPQHQAADGNPIRTNARTWRTHVHCSIPRSRRLAHSPKPI